MIAISSLGIEGANFSQGRAEIDDFRLLRNREVIRQKKLIQFPPETLQNTILLTLFLTVKSAFI